MSEKHRRPGPQPPPAEGRKVVRIGMREGPVDLARLGSEPTVLAPIPAADQAGPQPAEENKDGGKQGAGDGYFIGRLKNFGLTYLSVIGEGGMGKVYRCREDRLDRIVAVKVMLRQFFHNEEVRERFYEEARALARMNHPNIITIHRLEVDKETEDIFMVMEHLKGMDLYGLLEKRGTLEWGKARTILDEICSALEAAHTEGIVHRDIKPENIFINKTNGTEHVKLLDFGLAKMTDSMKAFKTKADAIFGSLEYMSPEQALGHTDKVDHRSDIYSLGAVMYHMITGSAPFPIDPRKTEQENVLLLMPKIVYNDPQTPRQKAPDKDIPPDVEAVIMKCLQKDPDKRYQSVAELREAIAAAKTSLLEPGRSTAPSSRDLFSGRVLKDNYVIDEKIGQGVNGRVYASHDKRNNTKYAVKFLSASVDDESLEQMQRRADILSRLNHPNIANVVDVARTEDKVDYVVTEHMTGNSLSHVLKQGNLSLNASALIIDQMCDGLGAAHEKGVIHQGLKPSNIFIEEKEGKETVKMVDFGLRRRAEDIDKLGTPAYMAPEVALGEKAFGNKVDHRADVYSLGVMFYEMVTGVLPFEVSRESEIIRKNVNERPVPPSVKRPDIQIPPEVEQIIMRCMAKESMKRFGSVAEIKAALRSANVIGLGADLSGPKVVISVPPSPGRTSIAFGSNQDMAGANQPQQPAAGKMDKTILTTRKELLRGSRRRIIATVAAATIGTGAVAVIGAAAFRTSKPQIVAVEPAPVTVTPVAEIPKPKSYKVVIKTDPTEVEVMRDGNFLCQTSLDTECSVDYSVGSTPMSLMFSKSGFLAKTQVVSPESSYTLEIKMDPEPVPQKAKPDWKKPPKVTKPVDVPFKIRPSAGK